MDLNRTLAAPDKQADDEVQLATRAASGDRRAFAALYERHLDAIYRYAFYRLRTDAEANDVTSEVFHRALVAMPTYQPRRPFLAFLSQRRPGPLRAPSARARPRRSARSCGRRSSPRRSCTRFGAPRSAWAGCARPSPDCSRSRSWSLAAATPRRPASRGIRAAADAFGDRRDLSAVWRRLSVRVRSPAR